MQLIPNPLHYYETTTDALGRVKTVLLATYQPTLLMLSIGTAHAAPQISHTPPLPSPPHAAPQVSPADPPPHQTRAEAQVHI
jgi:hypothetical protein